MRCNIYEIPAGSPNSGHDFLVMRSNFSVITWEHVTASFWKHRCPRTKASATLAEFSINRYSQELFNSKGNYDCISLHYMLAISFISGSCLFHFNQKIWFSNWFVQSGKYPVNLRVKNDKVKFYFKHIFYMK